MAKILIVSSNIHPELSVKQLQNSLDIIKDTSYQYQVESIKAGSYEIPFVINHYHNKNPFDGYIALGLILKKNLDHYHYIMNHVSTCFTQFALQGMIVGNGIITGLSLEELETNLDSKDPCLCGYISAFNAVNSLIKFKSVN
ncbi:6,7-dimethyl-8-ribityllumazine synthase [Legionella busanensis]|uniref:6,7-dimethyl-8-ribityllumazine synthase n=1 Tax=Legionella busanensis TaxID=190655 RepID=A0A378JNK8_9GAMM|nr:6,7-dimethyl-8-ribityllumazine synthase [Legionella busanensis]STX51789.1 6,7-dimethyl-8-ribityllumazine synthase [Legionella busanensis]